MFNFYSNSSFGDMFGEFNFLYNEDGSYDWDELKKQGTVTENIEEKNGFKTITRTFVSLDGSKTISSVTSIPIVDDKKQSIIEIDKKIKDAISKEEYELAAKLKKQKDKLLGGK